MRKAQTMTRFAVLFVLALALVAVCTSAQQQGAPEVACKGPSGQNVDWWLMYQYNLLNPISYADSTNPGVFDVSLPFPSLPFPFPFADCNSDRNAIDATRKTNRSPQTRLR